MIDWLTVFATVWRWGLYLLGLLALQLALWQIVHWLVRGAAHHEDRHDPLSSLETPRLDLGDPRDPPLSEMRDVWPNIHRLAPRSFRAPAAKGFDKELEPDAFERALARAHGRRRPS